jgi:hypothetical protein
MNARRARRRRPASASLVLERRSHSPLSAATQQPRSGPNVHRGALGRRGRKARAEQHRALPGVKMPAPNAWQQGGPETWSISGPPGAQSERGGPAFGLTDPRRRQATSFFGRADQTSVIRPNPRGGVAGSGRSPSARDRPPMTARLSEKPITSLLNALAASSRLCLRGPHAERPGLS